LPNDAEKRLRLAAMLVKFWRRRGYSREGRRWLATCLPASDAVSPTVRVKATNGAGILAWDTGDFETARRDYMAALTLYQALKDQRGVAGTLNNLAILAGQHGELAAARDLYEKSLTAYRSLGDRARIATILSNLGPVKSGLNQNAEARADLSEALSLFEQLGNASGVADVLHNLADIDFEEGDFLTAHQRLVRCLTIRGESGDKNVVESSVFLMALVEAGSGHPLRSVRLFGAAEAARETLERTLSGAEAAAADASVRMIRSTLGEERFLKAWQEGRTMSPEAAVQYAASSSAAE
jgi:tetratricopeptide (TPR) repeat protein